MKVIIHGIQRKHELGAKNVNSGKIIDPWQGIQH